MAGAKRRTGFLLGPKAGAGPASPPPFAIGGMAMVPESYLMSGALGGAGMLLVPTSTREERTAALLERFRYADSWRKQYDARAVEWYKLYIGHVDRDIRAPEGERSHLHIPRTYEQIDTLRARFVKSFFSVRPYLEFLPRPEDGGQPGLVSLNEVKAEVAAALVNEQLDKNNIVRVFYDFVTSFLVFPAGVSCRWAGAMRSVPSGAGCPGWLMCR